MNRKQKCLALIAGTLTLTALPTITYAASLAQGDDPTAWPIIAAFLSLLGVGAFASLCTTLLLKAAGVGIKPETIVYGVCLILVTIAFIAQGNDLPLVDFGDPAGTVTAWVLYIKGLEGLTKFLYEIVLKKVWPSPAPATGPRPL